MKFLFDQNISHRILRLVSKQFAGYTTAKKEGLINAKDKDIWEFAKTNNYVIITQDSDFNDLNSLYGFPPKVIWIRTGNLNTRKIADILLNHTDEIKRFVKDNKHGCLEIFSLKTK